MPPSSKFSLLNSALAIFVGVMFFIPVYISVSVHGLNNVFLKMLNIVNMLNLGFF